MYETMDVPLSLASLGSGALAVAYYGYRRKEMVRTYLEQNGNDDVTARVIGNYPLRFFDDGLYNYTETPTSTKLDREQRIIRFVRNLLYSHRTGTLKANLEIQDNPKPVSQTSAPEDEWWARRFTLTSLFPEEEERWTPVSFVISGTERAVNGQHLYYGAVKKMVIETDTDISPDTKFENVKFKIYATLIDTNWRRAGQPNELYLSITHSNQQSVSTILTSADGAPLPIFVSLAAWRFEGVPVSRSDDVWAWYREEGIRLDDGTNTVRMAEPKGAQLAFLYKAIEYLFKAKGVKTVRNVKEGEVYIHAIAGMPSLPLQLFIGSDKNILLKEVRIATSIPLDEIEGWDANQVHSISMESVDGDKEYLLDTNTGNWIERNSALQIGQNELVDLVVLSDIPVDNQPVPLPSTILHGKEFFDKFPARVSFAEVSVGLNDYLLSHAVIPELPKDRYDNEFFVNMRAYKGSWRFIFGLALFFLLAWIPTTPLAMERIAWLMKRVFLCIALVFIALGVSVYSSNENELTKRASHILTYPLIVVMIMVAAYVLLISRYVSPGGTVYIAMLACMVAVSLNLLFPGEYTNRDTKQLLVLSSMTAAFLCFTVATIHVHKSTNPGAPAPIGTFGMLFFLVIMLLYSSVQDLWKNNNERHDHAFFRALKMVENADTNDRAKSFYFDEANKTEPFMSPALLVGFAVIGIVIASWVLQPVSGKVMASPYTEWQEPPVIAAPRYGLILLAIVLAVFVFLFRTIFYQNTPSKTDPVCQAYRDDFRTFNEVYEDNLEFDVPASIQVIENEFRSAECFQKQAIASDTVFISLLLLWLAAYASMRGSVAHPMKSANFLLFTGFGFYLLDYIKNNRQWIRQIDLLKYA